MQKRQQFHNHFVFCCCFLLCSFSIVNFKRNQVQNPSVWLFVLAKIQQEDQMKAIIFHMKTTVNAAGNRQHAACLRRGATIKLMLRFQNVLILVIRSIDMGVCVCVFCKRLFRVRRALKESEHRIHFVLNTPSTAKSSKRATNETERKAN